MDPVAVALARLIKAQAMNGNSPPACAAWRRCVRMCAKELEALSESHASSSVWASAGIAALVWLCDSPDAAAAAATALSHLSMCWHLRSSLSEQEHAANVSAIIEAGAIPSLVELLEDPDEPESNAGEKAAIVLHNLAQDAEGRAAIIREGAIPPLVALLSGGPESKAAHWAAGTLSWLAYKSEASRNPMVVAGAIPLLVALLRGGPESGAAAAAAVALSALVRSLRVYHTDVYTDVLEELARTQTSCSPWDRLREDMCRTASGRLVVAGVEQAITLATAARVHAAALERAQELNGDAERHQARLESFGLGSLELPEEFVCPITWAKMQGMPPPPRRLAAHPATLAPLALLQTRWWRPTATPTSVPPSSRCSATATA